MSLSLLKRFPVLGSSANPEKISLTVKGILGALVSVAVLFGVVLPMEEVSPLIEQVGEVITQIGVLVSTVVAIYGGIRRVAVKIMNK